MKRLFGCCVAVILLSGASPVGSQTLPPKTMDGQECLVIGGSADPRQGREFFDRAHAAWLSGNADQARDLYEQAVLADRSVLALDDNGMGMHLLSWYRAQATNGSATPALLCRLGYFENIMFGNLETAIEHYRQAGDSAVATGVRELALRESERLARELRFLREFQRTKAEAARRRSDADIVTYVEQRRQNGIQDQIQALLDEQEDLKERLNWLGQEEGTVQKDLFHSLWRANRYRRFAYFEPPSEGEVVDPLGSYYRSRNQAQGSRDQIAQIRAERSGIERRLKAIAKEILVLEKRGKP